MAPKESTNVVPFQDRAISYTVNGQEVRLTPNMVRQYLVTGNRDLVTDQEIIYFMNICRSRNLNPFNKDCYLIKYTQNEGAAIIVSIEKLRMVARQSEDCQGWEKGIIVQKPDGELRYSKGLILEGETLLGGYFKAKPRGWEVPFEIEVNLKGYIKTTREGKTTRFWSPENQPTMIAKVAEAQGLRTVWPEKTQGLYVTEEINDSPPVDVDFTHVQPSATGGADEPSEFNAAAREKSSAWPNPAFDEFTAETAAGNHMDLDVFKQKVMADGRFNDFWAAFVAQSSKAAPAAAPPKAAAEKKAPAPANGAEGPAWERPRWINLRGPGYADYLTANLEAFRSAPQKILLEAKGKWLNLYKGERAWPLDQQAAAPAPAANEVPKPTFNENEQPPWDDEKDQDPEKTELAALQGELRELAKVEGGVYLLQAQRDCGFAVGLNNLPPSVDGCNVLIEAVGRLLARTPQRQ